MRKLAIFALVFGLATSSVAADKNKSFTERYKGKYLLVLKEGLAFGVCEDHETDPDTKIGLPTLTVTISGDTVEYHRQTSFFEVNGGCGAINSQALHKGEVLKVLDARVSRGDYFIIAETAPHQLERGEGAFAHETAEIGGIGFRFKAVNPEEVVSSIAQWVKVIDTPQDPSAQIGNTASGIYVKQIKLGMTAAEVEQVLGSPTTLVDLESKKLYKYKDMTIEFKDGKVVDVR